MTSLSEPNAVAITGSDGLIPLTVACRAAGHSYPHARTLVERGALRHRARRPYGRGEQFLVDPKEFASDIERLPRCRADDCQNPVLGTRGFCGRHFSQGGREGLAARERQILAGDDRDWYTLNEASALSGWAAQTIKNMVARGELAGHKTGRHRRILKRPLEVLMADRGPNPERIIWTAHEVTRRRAKVEALAELGLLPGEIADRAGCSKPTVIEDLRVLGIDRPTATGRAPNVLPPEAREERERRAQALFDAGQSPLQIAATLGYSKTQVRRDLDAVGAPRRPVGRYRLTDARGPRRCARCGDEFVPKASAKTGEFCRDACAREFRSAAKNEALAERGLVGTSEAAAILGVSTRRAWQLASTGQIPAEQVTWVGQLRPVWGVSLEGLRRFQIDWARGGDGRRRSQLDPEVAVARRESYLASLTPEDRRKEEAAIRDQARRRARDLAARRRGRKRGTEGEDWFEAFNELRAEYDAQNEVAASIGTASEGSLSNWQICTAVAYEDFATSPARWSKYPSVKGNPSELDPAEERRATARVWRAVEPLLTLSPAPAVPG